MTISDARMGPAVPAEASTVHYPVNIRVTVPFVPRPLFVTLIIGQERRGRARLKQERRLHPLNTWGNLATFVATSTVFTIATLFIAFVMSAL
jgi:hypothetical protein